MTDRKVQSDALLINLRLHLAWDRDHKSHGLPSVDANTSQGVVNFSERPTAKRFADQSEESGLFEDLGMGLPVLVPKVKGFSARRRLLHDGASCADEECCAGPSPPSSAPIATYMTLAGAGGRGETVR